VELELLDLSDADRAFRDELRAWLGANIAAAADEHEWHRRLVAGRWVAPGWPAKWGGRDASLVQQLIHAQLMGEFDGPPPRNTIAIFNLGPMLMQWGTAQQQAAWLPGIISGEEVWCQGFSEPGAGSDLAALSMRAEDRGDHWEVTGQKVWTSLAAEAVRCLALVRTDTTGRKHEGITALAIDLDADGVEVRPLRELTGDDGFSEIFFDAVQVPKDRAVGEVGDGWQVAMSTLVHERLGAMKLGVQLRNRMDGLVELARTTGGDRDPIVRQRLADLGIRVDLMQLLTQDAMTALARGEDPGASLPLGKLQWGELMQELAEFGTDLQGPVGVLWRGSPHAMPGNWQHANLYSRMTTIAAGTTQVQKNIIAGRILGLPAHAAAKSRPATIDRAPRSADQVALRDLVRRFLDEQCPISWVRTTLDEPQQGADPSWKGLVELDLAGLLVPVEHGGLGRQHADVGVVLFELGRAVHPGPFASTALGALGAILLADDAGAAADLLPALAAGSTVGTVALLEPGQGDDWRSPATTATPPDQSTAATWTLTGTKFLVPDAMAADLFVVSARTADGTGLFAVEVGDVASVTPLDSLDPTRRVGEVVLRDAPARRLGAGDQSAALGVLVDRMVAGAVMDAAGAATRALEVATEYAKVRVQFDQPIGAFQAVQHLLADTLRRVELSRAAAQDALLAADGADPQRLHRAAAAAKAYAGDALHRATADVIQVLGGIGFTWEHDAHLFHKRAISLRHAWGGPARHREAYAALLLDA